MPGQTPREAKAAALGPVPRTLLALTASHAIGRSHGPEAVGQRIRLTFADFRPAPLKGTSLSLFFDHSWEVIEDHRSGYGPYRVSSRGYRYHFLTEDLQPALMFHWHPDSLPFPHQHINESSGHIQRKMHVPTGRVTVEALSASQLTSSALNRSEKAGGTRSSRVRRCTFNTDRGVVSP